MADHARSVGNILAPWPYLLFAAFFLIAGILGGIWLDPTRAILGGFDLAAIVFVVACAPLFRHEAADMRASAKHNDANRVLILILSAAVTIVILVTVSGELMQQGRPSTADAVIVIVTLVMSWIFSNLVYALHYAHLFYSAASDGSDCGGIEFPKTDEPDYWDFAYFSSCIGMTFQTSDSDITSGPIRRTAMFHATAAFVFNIGVIAFAINVLGSG